MYTAIYNVMPEAKKLLSFIARLRDKFSDAGPDANGLKPDMFTVSDLMLREKPESEVQELLHEFDSMTKSYDVDYHDRKVLAEFHADQSTYDRMRLSFAVRVIIHARFTGLKTADLKRLEEAQIFAAAAAEAEEMAS